MGISGSINKCRCVFLSKVIDLVCQYGLMVLTGYLVTSTSWSGSPGNTEIPSDGLNTHTYIHAGRKTSPPIPGTAFHFILFVLCFQIDARLANTVVYFVLLLWRTLLLYIGKLYLFKGKRALDSNGQYVSFQRILIILWTNASNVSNNVYKLRSKWNLWKN